MKDSHVRPKKSLGQHFLTSTSAVEAMIKSAQVQKGDTVLEIGPGKGVLTKKLLAHEACVIAVEKDDGLIPALQQTFEKEISSGQLIVIHGDILTEDLNKITNGKAYKLVANIPYYITGEIMRMFLTAKRKPTSITLLVQKEVAERIVAKPVRVGGDGKESILSLSVKFFGHPTYVQTVKRGSFNPQPNVDSAIIHISDISKIENVDEEAFFKLIKAGFKSKRKKLISNLSPLYDKSALARAFENLSLSENTRAEDLNIGMWVRLLASLT